MKISYKDPQRSLPVNNLLTELPNKFFKHTRHVIYTSNNTSPQAYTYTVHCTRWKDKAMR